MAERNTKRGYAARGRVEATGGRTRRIRDERLPIKGSRSQVPDDLGPDGDHADKQRQGSERGGFLNDNLDHDTLQQNRMRT